MQCESPNRSIRRRAFSCLQGALQSAELASTDHQEWTAVFSEVLFPLIERLLKPEVYQSDPVGMSETRLAVAKLLCKIFLHYLVTLTEWKGMVDTWFRILEQMDRLMNSGQGRSGMVSLNFPSFLSQLATPTTTTIIHLLAAVLTNSFRKKRFPKA